MVVVISGSAIGPLACSFCVEMPISAPKPNSPPSVNLVEAFTITAAESTPLMKASIAAAESLTMASVWALLQRRVCSVAGGWIAAPVTYPLIAVQIWVLGRRAGTTDPVAAALFPLLVVVFALIFVRSAFAVVFRRDVTWKGRAVDARGG